VAARAAAIAFFLAALASAGRVRAEDDPSCAKYQEPMAYNACLASHGPKANVEVGTHSGTTEPRPSGQNRRYEGEVQAPAGFGRWPRAQRIHGRVHMEFRVH
jgi:hypothetical protein